MPNSADTIPPSRYHFADLTLDLARRRVLRQGRPIELKALEFDLLRVLVESAPDVVNADALAENVWGRHFVSPENVAQRVMLLRQSLGDDADKRRYIETVRNRGYRLIPVVTRLPAESPRMSQWPRGLIAAVAALLALGITAAGGYWLAASGERAASLPNTIAVLPFENLSPDTKDAYFAVALHEEVINQLVKNESIGVIRAPSVAGYAKTSKTLPEIARDLNVATILEGTVAYADGRVALNATLTDTATGRQLWTDRYDRALVDVFDIQADIASRIAKELGAKLAPAESADREQRPTKSSEAYALYLEAVSKGGVENTSEQRIKLLDRAIGFDDGFTAAYALRARSYASLIVDNSTGDAAPMAYRQDDERRARADADRVLERDPTNVDALFGLGMIDVVSWHWTSARARFATGIRSEELSVSPLPIFTFILGQEAEALRDAQSAVELNPNDWLPYRNWGWVLVLARDYDGARDALQKARDVGAHRSIVHRWMAYVATARGDTSEALKEIRVAERLLGDERPRLALAEIAKVYGQLGEADEARRLFDEIMRAGDPKELGAGTLAAAYLAIGDTEHSLAWLRTAAEKVRNHEPDKGFWSLMHLVHDVTLHPTLARPEFREVLAQIRGD